ncbi:putative transcriptional regulator, MerR family [Oryzomicrobium terrae]|uniref:Putative transcriptional regulator, MerR family n=1 Tax=Oryzomicrobium terrae TaxID=1735038 RepID=A0A5C1E8C3_9RHOO|nr:Cu(I)-responsive transcriptional regulator [Oryzomicrobium terrae]QEL65216.1 putative transcriptional regulator, MerR family [Oryzomicrobium terrae]
MKIGEAAQQSGVSAKMIRHYEAIGLLPTAARRESGYREYRERDVATLRFIRAARDLGFGLDAIGDLLSLWNNQQRASRDVKALAERHIATLEAKVIELNAMIGALRTLSACCHGDNRPDCPILEGIGHRAGPPG